MMVDRTEFQMKTGIVWPVIKPPPIVLITHVIANLQLSIYEKPFFFFYIFVLLFALIIF